MESIQNQTIPPDEVIVVMSDVGKPQAEKEEEDDTTKNNNSNNPTPPIFCQELVHNITQVYTQSPVKLLCIGARILASRARNMGAMSSTSEVLSFMDADDVEFPTRNEVSKNVFACHNRGQVKVFLHSFAKHYTTNIPPAIPPNLQCAEQQEGIETLTGDTLYDILHQSHKRLWLHAKMAHGWPVVHRSVFAHGVRYSSLNHAEDCVFVRDILYTFGRHPDTAIFLNRPLAFYLQASETYRANFEKK
jgi:hypothetical protein